eukprot:5124614-Prymnesium_polylepis.1
MGSHGVTWGPMGSHGVTWGHMESRVPARVSGSRGQGACASARCAMHQRSRDIERRGARGRCSRSSSDR